MGNVQFIVGTVIERKNQEDFKFINQKNVFDLEKNLFFYFLIFFSFIRKID